MPNWYDRSPNDALGSAERELATFFNNFGFDTRFNQSDKELAKSVMQHLRDQEETPTFVEKVKRFFTRT